MATATALSDKPEPNLFAVAVEQFNIAADVLNLDEGIRKQREEVGAVNVRTDLFAHVDGLVDLPDAVLRCPCLSASPTRDGLADGHAIGHTLPLP